MKIVSEARKEFDTAVRVEIDRILAQNPPPAFWINRGLIDGEIAVWEIPDHIFNDKPVVFAEDRRIYIWVEFIRPKKNFFTRKERVVARYTTWARIGEEYTTEAPVTIDALAETLESLKGMMIVQNSVAPPTGPPQEADSSA